MKDEIVRRELDDSAFDMLDDASALMEGMIQEQEQEENQEQQEIEKEEVSPLLENEQESEVQQEVEESEQGEEAVSEVDADNNPKVLAEYWKSIGKLPEDFDTNNVVDYEGLDLAYRTHREEEIREEVESKLLAQYEQDGWTKEDLEYARLIRQGADPESLKEAVLLRNVATTKIDTDTDQGRADAEQIIRMYYADKGFKEAKIEKMVEAEFADDESYIETLAEAQQHFGAKADAIDQEEIKAATKRKEQEAKERETLKKNWISWLDRGEIAGAKYSKEEMEAVKKALFEPTEIITAENGKRQRVTLLQKKQIEAKKDRELGFKNIVEFILGYSKEDLKEEAKKEVNSEILKGLQPNKIVGTSRAPITKTAPTKETAPIKRREIGIY